MTSDSYVAVHNRLNRQRGPARALACVVPECGPAAVWAWQRTGESRTETDRHGHRITWGTSPDDYAPMCYSHSRMLDGRGTLTHCPRGHDRAEVGVTTQGKCRACQRSAQAIINARNRSKG